MYEKICDERVYTRIFTYIRIHLCTGSRVYFDIGFIRDHESVVTTIPVCLFI